MDSETENGRSEMREEFSLDCFILILIACRRLSDGVFNKMLIKSASLRASTDCSSGSTLTLMCIQPSTSTITLHTQIITLLQRLLSASTGWHCTVYLFAHNVLFGQTGILLNTTICEHFSSGLYFHHNDTMKIYNGYGENESTKITL